MRVVTKKLAALVLAVGLVASMGATSVFAETSTSKKLISANLFDYTQTGVNRYETASATDAASGTDPASATTVNNVIKSNTTDGMYFGGGGSASWNKGNDYNGVTLGLVEDTLSADGTPVFTKNAYNYAGGLFGLQAEAKAKSVFPNVGFYFDYDPTTATCSFDSSKQTATYNAASNTINVVNNSKSNGFFPFGNGDFFFGLSLQINFYLPESKQVNGRDMAFHFSGDDDVWVFIDGKLILDIGGVHGVRSGTIDFANGTATVDSVAGMTGAQTTSFSLEANATHTMKVFYMERGAGKSNCKMDFNLPTADTTVNHATLTGEKVWKNDTPADRPETITVRLSDGSQEIGTATISAADNWKFSFPIYDYSPAKTYTITEDPVPNYDSEIQNASMESVTTHQFTAENAVLGQTSWTLPTGDQMFIGHFGNDYCVWTPETLTATQQKMLYNALAASDLTALGVKENINFSSLNFVSGACTIRNDNGTATVSANGSGWRVDFSDNCIWDLLISGSCRISSSEGAVITNTRKPTYPVTYTYTNTPENAPALPAAVSYFENSAVSLAAVPSLDGLTFGGWKVKEGGTDASDFTMPAKAVELEGTWYVALNYDANGGTGSNPTVTNEFGKETSVLSNGGNVAREGYTFLGWNTKSDGSGTTVTGQSLTLATETTVYAIWEKIPPTPVKPVDPVKPVIPYNPGDSDEPDYPANPSGPVIPNQPVPLNPTPSNPGSNPGNSNTVTINGAQTPLASGPAAAPNTVTILDPNVALGALPKSGSAYALMIAAGSALLLGGCALSIHKKKDHED